MFDLATCPQPNTTSPAAVFGVPFDLRLARPTRVKDYPWTDYLSGTGMGQPNVDRLATYSLQLEDTLSTAIILSLFTDRRAGVDDRLPARETDRRGWIGDEVMGAGGETWGSGLWLCGTGKATDDVLERARFEAQEALAWLVRDGIASRIEVTAEWVGERGDRLAVRPVVYQPDQVAPVYDVLWGTSIRRAAA